MASKTEQLNSLFEQWERRNPDYHGVFVKDGIIDEVLFDEAKHKILFIAKEKNDLSQRPGDFREWWSQELMYTFTIRISEWSFGILNNFPCYDQVRRSVPLKFEALHQIAFMNVKKSGGRGLSEYDRITSHIKLNLDFIHEEIRIIDPDIIILGVSWKEIRTQLFPEIEWKESGYDIAVSRFNNSKVIDFYHPSSRNSGSASYCLLQNIINSDAFKEL